MRGTVVLKILLGSCLVLCDKTAIGHHSDLNPVSFKNQCHAIPGEERINFRLKIVDASSTWMKLQFRTNKPQEVLAEIFNGYGELIYSFTVHIPNKGKTQIIEPISDMEPGSYVLIISNKKKHIRKELRFSVDMP